MSSLLVKGSILQPAAAGRIAVGKEETWTVAFITQAAFVIKTIPGNRKNAVILEMKKTARMQRKTEWNIY